VDPANITYNETCEECDSLNLRLSNIVWNDEADSYEFDVHCYDCGTEWRDWADG
jgi:hypothetical protein